MAFFVEIITSSTQKARTFKTEQKDLEITYADNDSFDTAMSGDMNGESVINIHIGGAIFVTYRDTLLKVPNTRLAALASRQGENMNNSWRIFFDRNSFLFEYILDFYRTGELHLPSGRCGLAIKSELEFWGLDDTCISTCCWKTYIDSMEQVTAQVRIREEFSRLRQMDKRAVNSGSFRVNLWKFLEYPQSSRCAKIYAVISSLLVVVSLGVAMFGTMIEFRVDRTVSLNNGSTTDDISQIGKLERLARTRPVDTVIFIDLFCVVFVLMELFIKLLVCPNKLAFLKSFSTVSDVLFVLPVTVILFVDEVDRSIWSTGRANDIYLCIKALIPLRVLRLHKLARCVRGFVVLALSLKASAKELLLLMALALCASIIFAFAIFYAELTQDDTFPHAFMGMWWALTTMTSVGYGDVYPKTPIGYIVGVVCAIAGLILISLPVPMIANNFNTYYSYRVRPGMRSRFWN